MPGFLSRSLFAAATWLADDDGNPLGTAANPLRTTASAGTGTNANQVQGTSAAGAADDGSNPVKIGGVANTTPTAVTAGQRKEVWLGTRGQVITGLLSVTAAANQVSTGNLGVALSSNDQPVSQAVTGLLWSGGGNFLPSGDAGGAWVNPGLLPAATDRSGTATTTSGTLALANASRRGLNIQNIGANNIGVNEFGGTAAIGTAGTYTLAPGASMNIRTNRAVTVIAATASTAYSATEF